MREVLLFEPIYQERVWGGRTLESALKRRLPPDRPIGESWEIVDRPGAESRIRGGALKRKTLRSAIARQGPEIMGPGWPAEARFPILVKWLDCSERLSLQVHPPAQVAGELSGEPKTENWYVAHSAPGAQLIVGLKEGVTRSQFERAIAEGTAEACVREFPVAAGDSVLVKSGQVHAIDAGNLILEIQQNSDTTFRIYDWGRKGLDGNPRRLHVAASLRSILWDEPPPEPVRAAPTSGTIAECDEFSIRRVILGPGETLRIAGGEQPRLLSVVAGGVRWGAGKLALGQNALLPFSGEFTFLASAPAILLITENFVRRA